MSPLSIPMPGRRRSGEWTEEVAAWASSVDAEADADADAEVGGSGEAEEEADAYGSIVAEDGGLCVER